MSKKVFPPVNTYLRGYIRENHRLIMIIIIMEYSEIVREETGKKSLNVLTASCRLLYLRQNLLEKWLL